MNKDTDPLRRGAGGRSSKMLIASFAIAFMMVFSVPFLFTDGNVTDTDAALGASDATYPMISAGVYHTLALKDDGTVWAWGSNDNGKLGDGTSGSPANDRHTPVQVSGLTGVIAISAGRDHSMALKGDGTVYAWGYNGNGRLGDGTTTERTTPVQVLAPGGTAGAGPYLIGVTAISIFNTHSMALKADGTVLTWGDNEYGQLGIGSSDTSAHSTPVQVSGLTGVIAISAGDGNSMALKADGTVYAWGSNGNGRLGDDTIENRSTPVQVLAPGGVAGVGPYLTGVTAISAGAAHSMALKADGTVYAWGNNDSGRLGDGTYGTPDDDKHTPVQVSGLTGVIAISAGDAHSMALKGDGTVYAWGYNGNGRLGDGTTTERTTPVQVSTLTGAVTISAGYFHSTALKADGTVWAWGGNGNGRLGIGSSDTSAHSTPLQALIKMDVRLQTPNGMVYVSGVSENSVMLNWVPATSLTLPEQMKYYVYVSTNKFSSGIPMGAPLNSEGSSDNTYKVTGLTADTDYYFVVVAEDLAGNKIAYSQAGTMTLSAYDGGSDETLSPIVVMVITIAAIGAIFIAVAFLFFRKP